MTWQKWVLIAWIATGALVNIATVGKQRKPITPEVAAFALVIQVGIVALVVTA